jgi:hypothetical protein
VETVETMSYLNEARRDGVRGGSTLGFARSRRLRVAWIAGSDHDPMFAPFTDPAPDGAQRPRGSWISMRL